MKNKPGRPRMSVDETRLRELAPHLTQVEIAAELGSTRKVIQNRMKELGIPRRSARDTHKGSLPCPAGCRCGKHARIGNAQLAVTLYQQGGTSVDQMLGLTGMSRTAFYRELKAAGVPRNLSERTPSSKETKARHKRLHQARGPARLKLCVRHLETGVSTPARDWACIHGEDGMNIWADYVSLCRSCHIRYDREARWNPESQARFRASIASVPRKPWTPERRAAQANRSRDARTGRFT